MPIESKEHESRLRWILAALVVLAFVIRLGAVIATAGISSPPDSSDDSFEYDAYAWNIAQGNGFRGPSPDVADRAHLTAYRSPFPSFYYAAVYLVFGHSYSAAHVTNSLLGALTLLLVFGIGARCFSRRAGLIAAFLWAFYPISIYYNLWLHSEVLSTFILCASVWCCLRIVDESGTRWAVAAGIVLGFLLLSKPAYLLALPLMVVWGVFISRKNRPVLLRTAVTILLACLVVAPWAIRNKIVMGSAIPFSTAGGSLLLQANNRLVIEDPRYYGYAIWDTYIPEYAAGLKQPNDEIKRDAAAKQYAIQWLKENKDKWGYLARSKFIRLWTPQYQGERYASMQLAVSLYYGAILLLFVIGFWPLTRDLINRRHPGLIMHVMILATVLTAVVFHGQHRYRFPIDPLLICFAGAGLHWLFTSIKQRTLIRRTAISMHQIRRRPALPALLTLCFFAFAAWSRADNRKIDDFRVNVCGSRMERIQEAARQYYTAEGTPPASILALVPEYLPNLQAIHCPIHSLKYDEYCLLGSKDPAEGVNVISYQLDRSISGELVVVHKSAPKEHIRRVENALKPAVLADSRKRHTERSIAE